MKVTLRVSSLFLVSYIVVMMLGNFASSTIISLLHHGFAVLAAGLLVLKKYKPSKFVGLTAAYIVYLLITTFVANDCSISIYVVIRQLKILLFLAVMDQQVRYAPRRTVKLLFHCIFMLCTINLFCMIVMPRGVLQTDVVINEWTTIQRSVWPLGNANSMICWYLLLLLLLTWDHTYEQKSKTTLAVTVLIAILSIVLSKSGTSIVSLLIAAWAIWMGCFVRRKKTWEINIKTLYWMYIGIFIFIMAGQMAIFNPILKSLFGKDATFSLRTDIWLQLAEVIAENPLFGSGYIGGKQASTMLGNVTFSNAHNQILQTIWHGGIVGMLLLIFVFVITGNRIVALKNKTLKSALAVLLFALLVELLFEVALERFETWAFVMCCFLFAENEKEREKVQNSHLIR